MGRTSLVVFDHGGEPKGMLPCASSVFQAATDGVSQDPMTEDPTLTVRLTADGSGETVALKARIDHLTRANQNLFWQILTSGRRLEAEVATCGSSGVEYLYRIDAL